MRQHDIPAGTIVVGLDGSAPSRLALAWAIEQALLERRPLTVALAVEDGLTPEADERQAMQDARDEVARRAPELPVLVQACEGDPRSVLLELSRDAAMVVVGSRGRGPVRSLLLGSVGVAVTKHAVCPVVVVRPGNPGLVRQGVLVGVDGSERSLPTIEFAYRQASLHGLPLTVLHCFWDAEAVVAGAHVVATVPSSRQDEAILLAETVSGMGEKYPDVNVRTELARGLVDATLVRAGERMNLVVVGAHHGGAASEFIFGSVAATVVEHATCPVAVVPHA